MSQSDTRTSMAADAYSALERLLEIVGSKLRPGDEAESIRAMRAADDVRREIDRLRAEAERHKCEGCDA